MSGKKGGIMPEFKSCEEFRNSILKKMDEGRNHRFLNDDSWDLDCFDGEPGEQGWAERGRYRAIGVIKRTSPISEETIDLYAKRLELALEALKDEFCRVADDEDGFGASAVSDFIVAVQKLLK